MLALYVLTYFVICSLHYVGGFISRQYNIRPFSFIKSSSILDDGFVNNNSNNIKEDDLLYEMFLEQISSMNAAESDGAGDATTDYVVDNASFGKWLKSGSARSPEAKVVELPLELTPNLPLEVVYNKKLIFGNYLSSKRNSKGNVASLLFQRVTGEIITIDPAQVVSCWDSIADEEIPASPEDWANIASDALNILRNMSPRKSDLQEFWKIVSKRSSALSVDSLDLSVYVFQEKKFRAWIDPNFSAEDVRVRTPSAAQRYASALLLFSDEFHFKRRPTALAEAPPIDELEELYEDSSMSDVSSREESIWILEGCYKVLDEGLAMFREGEVFAEYIEERRALSSSETVDDGASNTLVSATSKSPFRAGCILRQLRAIEVFSMSPESMAPPTSVKHLLKKLGKDPTPAGAVSLLREINYSRGAAGKSVRDKDGAVRAMPVNVTPWSLPELEAAKRLAEDVSRKRSTLSAEGPTRREGKKGPSGRMDYRPSQVSHPVICIDNKRASFLDDAFSLSPETGEVLVHVVDVVEFLRKYEALAATARERASSIFLPSGSLHMLPFSALEALSLSSEGPNEVITVALSVDSDGTLIGYRVFPSVIGPVFPVDIETADEIIAGVGVKELDGRMTTSRAGFTDAVVSDIVFSQELIAKVIAKNPWVDLHFSTGSNREFKLNKKDGTYTQQQVEKTPGNRMINAMLTLFSNATCEFVQAKGFDVPVAWENRDRVDSSLIRRFGTQPLRNWLAQMQQKQIRSALKMELPLSRKDCAMAVSHHNSKRKQISSLEGRGREQMSFEALEAHCAAIEATGESPVVLYAEGLGRGGVVRLKDFKVEGLLRQTIPQGSVVKVSVQRLVPESKMVYLEVVEDQ